MSPKNLTRSSFASRLMDLVVLSVSFLLFVALMDIHLTTGIVLELVSYVGIVFVCLRVARRLIFEYVDYSKRTFNVLLGNVTGLISGAVLLLVVDHFVPFISQSIFIVICASILAFFILGTLSPLIKSSNYDKIIHH
jgi:hypothetical protein